MEVEQGESEGGGITPREKELQEEFERRCEREEIEHAEINDILHHMMTYLPQRCWLVLNDHHGVCEVCPLLSVHFLLGIPHGVLERAFAPLRWANRFKWPSNSGSAIFYTRSKTGDGLKLSYRKGGADYSPHAIWIWMDRSGVPPYRGPGDDYPKGHAFRRKPWHLLPLVERARERRRRRRGGMAALSCQRKAA